MIAADLHVHTVASGHAYSTLEECCRAAARVGLKMIAITDHGPFMPGGPHPYYFGNLRVLPASMEGVGLLKGVEANIVGPDGALDLEERYLKRLDIVLVGFHDPYPGGSVEENTRAVIEAMKKPWVHVVAHPGNPRFPVDPEVVTAAAVRLGVALEINNASLTVTRKGSMERCEEFARWIRKLGAHFIISSDAHVASLVGEVGEAVKLVERAGLDLKDALNSDIQKVRDFLRRRKAAAQAEEPDRFALIP